MVLDPERDQAEGQPINAGQAEITRIATEIEDELGVTDAFRHMHPNTKAYTRGTRRIDRIAIPREWLEGKPALSEARHVEREEVEIVVAEVKGEWRVKRPDHKAVEIRVRHSEEKRGKPEWKYAAWYPEGVKKEVKEIIKKNHRGEYRHGKGEDAEMAEGSKDDPSEARKGKKGGRRQEQTGTKRKERQMARTSKDHAEHAEESRGDGGQVPKTNRQRKYREGKGKSGRV